MEPNANLPVGNEFEQGQDRKPFVENGYTKPEEIQKFTIEKGPWKKGVYRFLPKHRNTPLILVLAFTIIGLLLLLGLAYLLFGMKSDSTAATTQSINQSAHTLDQASTLVLKSSTTTTMKAPLPVENLDDHSASSSLEAMDEEKLVYEELVTPHGENVETSTTETEVMDTATEVEVTTQGTTSLEVETTQDELHPMEYFGNNMDKNSAEDCLNHYANGGSSDVYPISHKGFNMKVYCDMDAENGGWTVIQRRVNGNEVFHNRLFKEYVNGFGNLKESFWLGLENIHQLAPSTGSYVTLRIELTGNACDEPTGCAQNPDGFWFGEWDFRLGDKKSDYTLDIVQTTRGNLTSKYSDMFYTLSNGQKFTTRDKDNDQADDINCASFRLLGGWWHSNCTIGALNGLYEAHRAIPRYFMWNLINQEDRDSVATSHIIHPKESKMMIRPKF